MFLLDSRDVVQSVSPSGDWACRAAHAMALPSSTGADGPEVNVTGATMHRGFFLSLRKVGLRLLQSFNSSQDQIVFFWIMTQLKWMAQAWVIMIDYPKPQMTGQNWCLWNIFSNLFNKETVMMKVWKVATYLVVLSCAKQKAAAVERHAVQLHRALFWLSVLEPCYHLVNNYMDNWKEVTLLFVGKII